MKTLLLALACSFIVNCVLAQENRMLFFPATETHFAGVNIYNTSSGEVSQYYVQNNTWVRNRNVLSPRLSIRGRNIRMQNIDIAKGESSNLFVYSADTGEFEFLYLEEGRWISNTLLPNGKVEISSPDLSLEFTPAIGDHSPYIFAYSDDLNKVMILGLSNSQWMSNDFFPDNIQQN